MIVGTAGHIDHGKTSLVRALTGIDTDRLKQEKIQGISIELGYAYVPVGQDQVMGFIDVPGHERLVHTMAAGASGVDFGLLVVAADDGVMPQTREHLSILTLLGVQDGAVAITKVDRVDPDRLQEVRQQLVILLQDTFLAHAPIFDVCATDVLHDGIQDLREYLKLRQQSSVRRSDSGLFRLAIDRAFTLHGHGTVVTGTVHAGQLHLPGDGTDLRLMPSGKQVRIRSLRVQNQVATAGRAGQRCALNLAGLGKNEIARGDWIADVRCFTPSTNIDVELTVLASAELPIRSWTAVHVHMGAARHMAHLVPLTVDTILPEQTAMAQLVFERPVCAMSGDRFIVRNAQARMTLGGGMVIDPNAPDRKRRSAGRLAWLGGMASALNTGDLTQLLDQAPYGLDHLSLMRLSGNDADMDLPEQAIWVGDASFRESPTLILQHYWDQLATIIVDALNRYHQAAPDEPGVDVARLKRMAAPRLSDDLWGVRVRTLLEQKTVMRNGPWLYRPGHEVVLMDRETRLAQRLLVLIQAGGFDPPWTRELAHELGDDEDEVRALLRKLVRHGTLFQVVRDLFYHRQKIAHLAQLVASLAALNDGVRAAEFRDATGLGRKRAIQVLEFFGRVGYTRRVGDAHVLRPGSTLFNEH